MVTPQLLSILSPCQETAKVFRHASVCRLITSPGVDMVYFIISLMSVSLSIFASMPSSFYRLFGQFLHQ